MYLAASSQVVEISCATCNSYAVTDTGAAYAWGFGENYQLATGKDEDALSPTEIKSKSLDGANILHVWFFLLLDHALIHSFTFGIRCISIYINIDRLTSSFNLT